MENRWLSLHSPFSLLSSFPILHGYPPSPVSIYTFIPPLRSHLLPPFFLLAQVFFFGKKKKCSNKLFIFFVLLFYFFFVLIVPVPDIVSVVMLSARFWIYIWIYKYTLLVHVIVYAQKRIQVFLVDRLWI